MEKKCNIALIGECMIELRGQMFGTMQESFGGDTLNTAVYLSRLGSESGINVFYATQLGTDVYSEAMIRAWKEENIDVSLVSREGDRMPGLYTIQVDEKGERTFYYWRDSSAAKAYFQADTSPLEKNLENLNALYYSGISLAVLPPKARERLFQSIDIIRKNGGLVIFDSNYRKRLWMNDTDTRAWYDRAYANADMAMITLEDNECVYDIHDDEKALEHAFSLPPKEIVVKRGIEPTLIRIENDPIISVPVYKVSKVVDTTGAGDSFAGGYLAARLRGMSPTVGAKSGNKLASIVIQYHGAIIPRENMPEFFYV